MGLLQPEHLLIILVLVLIVFGAGRLPDTLRELGKGVRSFRDAASSTSTETPPAPLAPPAATCNSCAKPLATGAKFCSNCGQTV